MSKYLREQAVDYATLFALSPNPHYKYFDVIGTIGGDCTNFTSQCLKAGGAPFIFDSSHPWWYKNKYLNTSWSVSWAVAHSLYWCLKVNHHDNLPGPKGSETKDIYELKLGDLIFYEDINGLIFHSAIITSFSHGKPLISQHTFNALNIPYEKSYRATKTHFIKISL